VGDFVAAQIPRAIPRTPPLAVTENTWRVGRWLSADWSAVPAPVPYANLTNPQTLNLYAMVSDNPEAFADLDGHCLECLDEVEEVAESPEGQAVIGGAEGLAKEFGQDVIESAQEDWSAYKSLAGWLQGGVAALALSLKGDKPPAAKPGNAKVEEKSAEPQPKADGAGAMKGGGRNDEKANPDRVKSAKDKPSNLKQQRDAMKSKPNKTPEDKSQLEKLNKAINREIDRTMKSETHSRKEKQ